MTEKKIGDLNGRWSLLFRAMLAITGFSAPFVLAFGIWVTNTLSDIKTELAVMNTKQEVAKESFRELKFDIRTLKERVTEIEKKIE